MVRPFGRRTVHELREVEPLEHERVDTSTLPRRDERQERFAQRQVSRREAEEVMPEGVPVRVVDRPYVRQATDTRDLKRLDVGPSGGVAHQEALQLRRGHPRSGAGWHERHCRSAAARSQA